MIQSLMESRLPPLFPLRALAVCSVLAVMVLWMGGGSAMDALRLLSGLLPVGSNEEGLLRLLLGRTLASFGLVTLALVLGLGLALTVTIFVSPAGRPLSRAVGWFGSALSGVPPMAWALGALLLLIQHLNLPVETLFPYEPPDGKDSWTLTLGRTIWAWMVPAVVLAVPVFGSAVYTLTHRLSALLVSGTLAKTLKGRGLKRSLIVYHHMLPELRSQILTMSRPLAAMTLTLALPVEEAFRFDGWGSFSAAALRSHDSYQIATAVYIAGFMLAAWYAVTIWLEGLSRAPRTLFDAPPEETRSVFWAGCGVALAAGLLTWPHWLELEDVWHVSYLPSFHEIGRAVGVAVAAAGLIVLSGPLMVRRHNWLRASYAGMAMTWAAAPLLLCWLALSSVMVNDHATMLWLIMAAALPSTVSFRENFRTLYASDFVTSSLVLGAPPQRIWWQHLFPNLLPVVLNRLCRSVATLLLWSSLLGYFGLEMTSSGTPTWGAQMRQGSEMILDSPLAVLAPAVWLALWSLSFRLVSRAFSRETPRPKTSPFDP